MAGWRFIQPNTLFKQGEHYEQDKGIRTPEGREMNAEITIRHVLSDGRKLDRIDGFVIPNSGLTAAVYHMAADLSRKRIIPKEAEDQ